MFSTAEDPESSSTRRRSSRGTLAPMVHDGSTGGDGQMRLRSRSVLPPSALNTHVRSVTLNDAGHTFTNSAFNDLVMYTDKSNQRILIGTDLTKPSAVTVSKEGTKLRGLVEIEEELKIGRGRINMVGGFAVDTGAIIEGDATVRSSFDVFNGAGDADPLLRVRDGDVSVFRRLNVIGGGGASVEGDLSLSGAVVSDMFRVENDMRVGGSLWVGPNDELTVREGQDVQINEVVLRANAGLEVFGGLDTSGNFTIRKNGEGDGATLMSVTDDETSVETPLLKTSGDLRVEGKADVLQALDVYGASFAVFDGETSSSPLFSVSGPSNVVNVACNLSVGGDADIRGNVTTDGDARVEGELEVLGGFRVSGGQGMRLEAPLEVVSATGTETPLFRVEEARTDVWTDVTRLWGDLSVRPGGATAPVLISATGSDEKVRIDADLEAKRSLSVGPGGAEVTGDIVACSDATVKGDAAIQGGLDVGGDARMRGSLALEGGRFDVTEEDETALFRVTPSNVAVNRPASIDGTLRVTGEGTVEGGLGVLGDAGVRVRSGPLAVQDDQVFAASNFGAANPAYSWTGDTDTGMYLAAPDAIGLATAGVERARLTETGDLRLSGGGDFVVEAPGKLVGDGGGLSNLNASQIGGGVLSAEQGGTGRAGTVANKVAVGGEDGGAMQYPDGLHWDAIDERLGVGTSNPAYALDVRSGNGDAHASGRLLSGLTTTAASPAFTWSSDQDTGIYRPSEDTLAFGTAGAERARFTNEGRFGVGTASPEHRFHVSGGDFALDGRMVSGVVPAERITEGTLPVARGGTGVPTLSAAKLLVGRGTEAGVLSPPQLHWNDEEDRLGINTDNPRTSLDVNGVVTASSFTGDGSGLTALDAGAVSSGTLSGARGGTGVDRWVHGKVAVGYSEEEDGSVTTRMAQPDALHWDIERRRLGINTDAPRTSLDVKDGTVTAAAFAGDGGALVNLNASAASSGTLAVARGGTGSSGLTRGKVVVGDGPSSPALQPDALHWDSSNERLGLGTDTPRTTLDVPSGTVTAAAFAGDGSALTGLDMDAATAGKLAVARGGTGRSSLLTSKILVGQGNELEVGQPTDLHWDYVEKRLGVGTSVPRTKLDVDGTVIAASFAGDGSALTDLDMGAAASGTKLAVARGGTGSSGLTRGKVVVGDGPDDPALQPDALHWDASNERLGVGTSTPRTTVDVPSGTVTAAAFAGDGADLANLTANAVASGTLAVARGGTGSSGLTRGKVVVGDGPSSPALQPDALHWDSSNERLGLGTDTPRTTLDVPSGTVTAAAFAGDGSALTGLDMDAASAGVLTVSRGGTGGAMHTSDKLLVGRGSDAVISPAELHWDRNRARLGVNTASPRTSLDVQGTVTATAFAGDGNALTRLNVDAVSAGALSAARGGTGRAGLEARKLLVGGTDADATTVAQPAALHWDDVNQRLGVNTDVPGTTLDVDGTVRAAAFVGDGRGLSALDMDAATRGTLAVRRGGTGASNLEAGKILVGAGSAAVLRPVGLHWDAAAERLGVRTAQPEKALDVRGDVSAEAFVGDGRALTSLDAGSLAFGTTSVPRGGTGRGQHADGKILVGSGTAALRSPSELHWDAANARFGLGTASPARTMHVVGVTRSSVFEGGGEGLSNLNAGHVSSGTLAVARGGTGAAALAEGKLLVGRGTASVLQPVGLHWNSATERLGVNTSSPGHALDVTGSIRANDQLLGNVSDTAARPAHSWAGDADTGMFRPSPDVLAFSTDGVERARFTDDGRVGFGTSTPNARVHVEGDLFLAGRLTAGSLSTERITEGVLPVARGGTGASALEKDRLLIGGGGSDAVRGVSGLRWRADADDEDEYEEGPVLNVEGGVVVRDAVRAEAFEGDGRDIRELDADAVSRGLLKVERGGTGAVSHAFGKLLVGKGGDPIEGPSALHWDLVRNRLGINTASPRSTLDLPGGTVTASAFIGNGREVRDLDADKVTAGTLIVERGGTGASSLSDGKFLVGRNRNAVEALADFEWDANDRRFRMGASDVATASLDVTGRVTATAFTGDGKELRALDADQVTSGTLRTVYGGTGRSSHAANKLLVGRGSNAIMNPTGLHWDDLEERLGVGVSAPETRLHVDGTVLATAFVGDGNALVNVDLNDSTTGVLDVANGGTGSASHSAGRLMVGDGSSALRTPNELAWDTVNKTLSVGTCNVDVDLRVSAGVSAASFSGDGAALTNLNANEIRSGTLVVRRGGTGRSTLSDSKLLVGRGQNAVDAPADLHWSAADKRLSVGSTDFGADPVSMSVTGSVEARDFEGDGTLVRNLDVNKVASGTLDVRFGGSGRSSHTRGKLLVGDSNAAFMNPADLTWDAAARRLIVGSTPTSNARGRLHVDGDVHADRFVGQVDMDLATRGVLAVGRGGTGRPSHTVGKVLVGAGSAALLNAARLTWDEANARLGVGRTSAPQQALDVEGGIRATTRVQATADRGHDTASAPAFSWSGDADTGMFRADANTLAFATRGEERMRFDDVGYTGIGTKYPETRLHVAGDFSLNGRMVSGGLSTDRLDAGVLPVVRGGSGRATLPTSKLLVGSGTAGVSSPTDLHWNSTNAFLGLGTIDPGRRLDVRGATRSTTFEGDGRAVTHLDMANAQFGQLAVPRGGTGRGQHTSNKLLVGNGTDGIRSPSGLHWNEDDTRLGIGVTDPRANLDVAGEVRAQTRYLATAGNDSSNRPAYSWFNDADTGMFRPATDVLAFATEGIERARFTDRGLMGVNKTDPAATLHVGGDIAMDGTLVSGDVPVARLSDGQVPVPRGGSGRDRLRSRKLLVGNDTDPVLTPELLHWDVARNRLGVGSVDPQDTLDVVGGVRALRFAGDGSALTNISQSSITQSLDGGATFGVSSGGTGRSSLAANKLLVGDGAGPVRTFDALHWNPNFSRLGVAREDPQETLDVGGNVRASGRLLGTASGGGGGSAGSPSFGWSGDAGTGMYRPSENVIGLATARVERIRLTNDGRVGVGGGSLPTSGSAANSRLHVNGDMTLSGRLLSGSLSTDRIDSGRLPVPRGGTGKASHTDKKVLVGNGAGDLLSANLLHWDEGNALLGIGTDDPQAALHVEGDIISSGQVTADSFVGDGSGLTNINSSSIGGTNPDGTFSVSSGGTGRSSLDRYKILIGDGTGDVRTDSDLHWEDGRLGVGTATPDVNARMQVAGRLRATSFEGDGANLTGLNANNVSSGILSVARGGTGGESLERYKLLVGDGSDPISSSGGLHWQGGRLGVNTASPQNALHVSGGSVRADAFIGDGSQLTNLNLAGGTSGSLGVTSGGTGRASFAQGRVLVGNNTDGIQSYANFFWDAAQNRLGLNVTAPSRTLEVGGTALVTGASSFQSDLTCEGRLVVQDGRDGGEGRGIYTWSADNTQRGIYMASSGGGRSLNSGEAVAGYGFSGLALRLRCTNSSDQGFILENASEQRLVSVRGSDGLTNFRGDTVHHGKIVVQDGQDGGAGRGVHLWTRDDTDWGLYLASSGGGRSLAGTSATGGSTFSGLSARIRVADASASGFIVENSANDMLFSIRGDDGLTSFGGDVRFDRPVTFLEDVMHRGKLVIMDGQDGGSDRGLYLFDINDTNWGLYVASQPIGTSFAGGPVTSGDSFIGLSARIRVPNDEDNGFLIENAGEELLMSVRGNDGLVTFRGDTAHKGKIIIQNDQDGGNDRGIFMVSGEDADYGIYAASSLSGTSIDGSSSPVQGYDSMREMCIRFRAPNNNENGFIFENSSDELLVSIRGDDGLLLIKGDVIHNGKIVVQEGQNGGMGRGIHMWTKDNTDRGIYLASPGINQSLAAGTAVTGNDFQNMALRFRMDKSGGLGFIFENSIEEKLLTINAENGNTYIAGDLTINGNLVLLNDLVLEQNLDIRGHVNHVANGWTRQNFVSGGVFNGKFVINQELPVTAADAFEFYVASWEQPNTVADQLLIDISYSFNMYDVTDIDVNGDARQASRQGRIKVRISTYGEENGAAGYNEDKFIIDELHHERTVLTEFISFEWNLRSKQENDNPDRIGLRELSLFVNLNLQGSGPQRSGEVIDIVQASFEGCVRYEGESFDVLTFTVEPSTSDTDESYRINETEPKPLDNVTTGWNTTPVRLTARTSQSGNIGLGTQRPEHQLDILESESDAIIRMQTHAYCGLSIHADTQGSTDANAYASMSTAGGSSSCVWSCVKNNGAAAGEGTSYIGTTAGSTLLGTTSNDALHLGTNNTVRLSIDNAGNFGINTPPSPQYTLDVAGTVRADAFYGDGNEVVNLDMDNAGSGTLSVDRGGTGTYNITANRLLVSNISGNSVSTPGDLYWSFNDNRLGIGTQNPTAKLYVNGNIRASEDIIAESDRRLKSQLSPVEDALQKILSITGYTFSRTDLGSEREQERFMGLIAQEVLEIAPEAVQRDANDMYAVAYGNLSALFVEAIKQLHFTQETMKRNCEEMKHILDSHTYTLEKLLNQKNDC